MVVFLNLPWVGWRKDTIETSMYKSEGWYLPNALFVNPSKTWYRRWEQIAMKLLSMTGSQKNISCTKSHVEIYTTFGGKINAIEKSVPMHYPWQNGSHKNCTSKVASLQQIISGLGQLPITLMGMITHDTKMRNMHNILMSCGKTIPISQLGPCCNGIYVYQDILGINKKPMDLYGHPESHK